VKKFKGFLVAAGCFSLVGCAFPLQQMPAGLLASDVTVPSWNSVAAPTVGSKTGTSTCSAILGLFASGDASVKKAALNGGITKIMTVDTNTKAYLGGLYWSVTTIVTGE
jgi:hypothetical protein